MSDSSELDQANGRGIPGGGVRGADEDFEALCARLARFHVAVETRRFAAGVTAGGVALPVALGAGAGRTAAPADERLLCRVCALLGDGIPVMLLPEFASGGDEAIRCFEEFCAALKRALVRERLNAAALGVALGSRAVSLQTFLLTCSAVLGDGPRFALLDRSRMRHHENRGLRDEVEHDWSFMWRRRDAASPLLPAYAASVTTRCPLLDDEVATAVLPRPAVQAPPGSAWLPLELRLGDFSDGGGRVDWERLRLSLRACVDVGDQLLDRLAWPEAAQRVDACRNRRLAVTVSGIGDLIVEYGADPGDLRTLQWADRLMLRVSKGLWSRSQALASRVGALPALTHADPTAATPGMARKGDWQRRWRNAVARAAVRHRNLLVMSPYAVLPSGPHEIGDFMGLLPSLHHADAFCFSDPVTHGCRGADDFAAFHRRAFAVMERRNAASLVAAGA